MATLINGNGNPRIYAAQDADLIAALAGDITGIAQIGNKFAATAIDANTISVADGVIITKEGRRIQLDAGSTDMFVIPTGTTGVTNYYIIGYKLTTQSDDSQIAETFVQLMSSSSETITEDTFRSGATDVYISLYRVQQNGVNLGTITGLLPELTSISQLNNDLSDKADKLALVDMVKVIATSCDIASLASNATAHASFPLPTKTGYKPIMIIYRGNSASNYLISANISEPILTGETTKTFTVLNSGSSVISNFTVRALVVFIKDISQLTI